MCYSDDVTVSSLPFTAFPGLVKALNSVEDHSDQDLIMHMGEELGEAMKEYRKGDIDACLVELADLYFFILAFYERSNISLNHTLKLKLLRGPDSRKK